MGTSLTEPPTTVAPAAQNQLPAIRRRFEDDRFCVVMTGVMGTLIAIGLAVACNPAPQVHDEFAYLLSADTFAHGRVTNPTHPHWQHFETFHVIHQPTYTAKYPPAQALALAFGQLLGHPMIGVCLATGLSLAALVWMLLGWLPKWANLFAALIVVVHPGLQIVWGQTYMGGAVAMTGGALLLGAFIRLTRKREIKTALVAAVGISLLATTRPFEGAVLTISVLYLLLWQLRRDGWDVSQFMTRVVLPMACVGLVSGSLFLFYNKQVTGNPLTMPYRVNQDTYGWNPLFLWTQAGDSPAYRHEIMRKFHEDDLVNTQRNYGTLADGLASTGETARSLVWFFCGFSLLAGLAGVPRLLRHEEYRWALLLAIPAVATAFATPWGYPHYLAPVAPLILLFAIGGLTELWAVRAETPLVERWNWRAIAVLHAAWFLILAVHCYRAETQGWQVERREFERQLAQTPDRDLVFVRYADHHNFHNEWVYNKSDIDNADVVWAREISEEKVLELIDYFSDRKVWLLLADGQQPGQRPVRRVLQPYPQANQHTSQPPDRI